MASRMLAGSLSYLEGTRRICTLSSAADLSDDPDFSPFVAVDSGSDMFPVDPDVRKLWSAEALEKLQPEIDATEKWAREALEKPCHVLVGRFEGRVETQE